MTADDDHAGVAGSARRLDETRLALISHMHGRGRLRGQDTTGSSDTVEQTDKLERRVDNVAQRSGRLQAVQYALSTWWRHHPAYSALELARPIVSSFARRKPVQFLGAAALGGVVLLVARPWKLVSVTGLMLGAVKSSQLSALVMSAVTAAGYADADPSNNSGELP